MWYMLYELCIDLDPFNIKILCVLAYSHYFLLVILNKQESHLNL